MKKVLCVAAAVVLTLAAVALGAWRGWSGERASVLASFSSDSGLRDYLDTRSMDAANLRVVAADAELTKTAAALQKELPTLASVQSSSRDQAYITTLTRALLETQSVTDSYNEQVSSYNQRLNASLTGKLAQALGVQPLTAYGE